MAQAPKKPTQIRRTQQTTFRRHFLKEWLEEREMEPMDLVNTLNEAADMSTPVLDKSQVYRWLKGQLPHRQTQVRIAAALQLINEETGQPDPEMLMSHPAQDWIAQKVRGLDKTDVDRIKEMIELALSRKTGTRG